MRIILVIVMVTLLLVAGCASDTIEQPIIETNDSINTIPPQPGNVSIDDGFITQEYAIGEMI